MPKDNTKKKDNAMAIAIIGLIGTLAAALLGSPVLVELIQSRQATATQPAMVETPAALPPEAPIGTNQVLIFREDFDSDKVSGFSFQGDWQVGKDKSNRILETSTSGKATFGPSDFSHGIIEFYIRIQAGADNASAALSFRDNGQSAYTLVLSENHVLLGYREGSATVQPLNEESSRSLLLANGDWYLIRIEARGSEIILFMDNNRILSANDQRLSRGKLNFVVDEGMQAAFDDIKVWEFK